MTAKKKISKKKKEVTEVFEVSNGKEKIVKTKSTEEVPVEAPGQRKRDTKILKIFLISAVGIILLLIAGYFYLDSLRHSTYEGIPFTTVQEGEMTLYKTTFPALPHPRATNFYFHNKPSFLKRIPFDRTNFKLMKFAAFNGTDLFDCYEGDEVIAEVTLIKAHEVLGIPLEKVSSGCDAEGRYNYFNFMPADKTEIIEVGKNCYEVHVADCEIMAATEKVIAEMVLDYNQK